MMLGHPNIHNHSYLIKYTELNSGWTVHLNIKNNEAVKRYGGEKIGKDFIYNRKSTNKPDKLSFSKITTAVD